MNRAIFMLSALTLVGATQAEAATIFVYGRSGTVGKYNASSGSAINSNFECQRGCQRGFRHRRRWPGPPLCL